MTGSSLLLLNAALSFVLLGLILTIQLVHYPAFGDVGAPEFAEFHRLHELRITPLVGPLMVAEACAAAALLVLRPTGVSPGLAWGAAILVAVVWLATFFVSVPLHGQLHGGYDADRVAALVRTNWIRTLAWTVRSGLLGVAVTRLIGAGP